jgi:hypothetical protein
MNKPSEDSEVKEMWCSSKDITFPVDSATFSIVHLSIEQRTKCPGATLPQVDIALQIKGSI